MLRLTKRRGVTSSARRTRTRPEARRNSRYADTSEYGYGGNVLRILLLRAATALDTEQYQGALFAFLASQRDIMIMTCNDAGKHEFSWALYPHQGQSDVPVSAYLFNSPLDVRYLLNGSSLASTVPHMPPFIVYGRSCISGDGDLDDAKGIRTVVLRLYEAYGGHASVCLQVNMPQRVIAAYGVNLLEDDVGADSLALERTMGELGEQPGEQLLRLVFRGFEVKTIKVVLAKDA
ncbi:hypothetical protein BGW80DRAFT_1334249 [Lactifluus volemus]|nr:hypothetical protein BGW80DRAFT_1334249 [Lactifluus volemus]